MSTEIKPTFHYTVNSEYNTQKVFPIDFSLREFDSNHKGNFTRIQKVVEHPLIKRVLVDLIYPVECQKSEYENGGIYPVPVEAETFLRCFYTLLENEKYHSTKKKQKELAGTTLGKEFSEDLCRSIAKSAFDSKEDCRFDDAAYCRHMLCQNDGFCHVVMDDLWEHEIENRIRQIKVLVANVSPARQAEFLQKVLYNLDSICLELIREGQSSSTRSNAEPPTPGELLNDLLSKRVKYSEKSDQTTQHKASDKSQADCQVYAIYEVNNVVLGIQADDEHQGLTLEEAFSKLENHRIRQPVLMKEARRAYIANLEKLVQQTPFEEQHFEILRYIDVVSETPDLAALEQQLTDIMKKQCCLEIDRLMQIYKNEAETKPTQRYLDALISAAAYSRVNQGVCIFEDVLHLVEMFSQMSDSGHKLSGVYTRGYIPQTDGTKSELISEIQPCVQRRSYFVQLQDFLVHHWTFTGHNRLIDETRHFIDIEHIAIEFSRGAQEAAMFLDTDSTLVRSEAETVELLQFCEDSVTQSDAFMPAHKIANLSFPILIMAVLQIFQRIVVDSVPALLKDFSTLQQLQKQVQEENQGT